MAVSTYHPFSRETTSGEGSDTIQPKKRIPTDSIYKASMRIGDSYFSGGQYQNAITEYEKGLKAKPNDSYAKTRLASARAKVAAAVKADLDYTQAVASGDNAFRTKDYLNAKAYYQLAIDAKPGDAYAKGKLKETMDLLRSMKASNILYDVAIAAAEKLFQEKQYEKAIAEFENAGRILPGEKYPRQRINEIVKIMVDIQTREAMYSKSIEAADTFYAKRNFLNALLEYKRASSLKPGEKYPQDRINELTALLAERKTRDESYRKAVAGADKLFSEAAYEPSRNGYAEASKIKPEEAYPLDRIREIDNILERLKNAKEEYDRLVDLADSLYIEKKYINAKANYQQALKMKPAESYPREMIAKAENLISGQQANEKLIEEAYLTALAEADRQYAAKEYEKAKDAYQNALGIKPGEQYPKDRIGEIGKIFAQREKQQQAEREYSEILAGANKLLAEKSYPGAKAEYIKALRMKPEEKYPKDKISEIDQTLAGLAKQKAIDDRYLELVAKADRAFTEKNWLQAKSDYLVASQMKPDEAYPKERLAGIERELASLAEQKVLDEKYAALLSEADKLFQAKSYPEAKIGYQKAGEMKPSESYPKERIGEIDRIITALEEQRSADEKYTVLIGKADQLLADKEYEQAKTEYQNASLLKPKEVYPREKIARIDEILMVIAKQKAVNDQYSAAVAEGDRLFSEKSYEPAKLKFVEALSLKASETYPKDKIAEIEKNLAELSRLKAIDDQYLSLLDKADRLLSEKSYEPARLEYDNAGKLKPGESYPKEKILEIQKALEAIERQKIVDMKYSERIANADKLLETKSFDQAKAAYLDASGMKPAEEYPRIKMEYIEKIMAEQARQREVEMQYKASVTKADQLLSNKSYEGAKTEFMNASSLKPDEAYPKSKIEAIEKILAEQKAFEDRYRGAIATGDTALAARSYEQAKAAFQAAIQMKPNEQYPKDRLAEIETTLAALAKQKAVDDRFNASVAKADKLFDDRSYAPARAEYENASSIKPEEQYPKVRIEEIDGIFAEIKAKDEAYKTSIAKGNSLLAQKSYEGARTEYQNASEIKPGEQFPKEKIAEINRILTELKGKRITFDELVSKGNEMLSVKDYYKAKDNYEQALSIFPEEAYPKERLSRINSVIDSIFRANKGSYDKAVAEGDRYFASMTFDMAIDSYQEASGYLPMEQYPKEMIVKIKRILAENAIVDIVNSAQIVGNGIEKQFGFEPVNIISRKNNYFYIKIRNLTGRPFNVMLRYGKDQQINGGAVIKNVSGDGRVNERLISVREQDPWYRNDNNWISLYPQGGDVEVTFLQISRSGQ